MTRPRPIWVPPMRDGVSASRVTMGDGRHGTVADFLVARFPVVGDWRERLAQGDVLGADGQPVAADTPCRPGLLLWYWRQLPPEPRVPFELDLLYQDHHLVVVDKPHFLSVTPSGRYVQETALVRLKQRLGLDTLAPMHRLDRDTAGVLVFTVQPATRHAYQALLRHRQVHKVYEAVAPWRDGLAWPMVCRSHLAAQPGDAFMQMRVLHQTLGAAPADGAGAEPAVEPAGAPHGGTHAEPNAETQIALIARLAAPRPHLAHYRLTPMTGRKHQLRAQLSALGLPIVGDRIYPTLLPQPAADAVPDYSQPLQLLAREFSFTDPFSGRHHRFVSQRQLQWVAQAGDQPAVAEAAAG